MIVVTKPTSPISDVGILLGRQGENNARQIVFDLSWLIEEYGSGTAVLVHQRSKDSAPYICTTTQDGSSLTWTLNNLDTAYDGWGQAELRWTVSDVLAKTLVYKTMVVRSITADSEIPDAYQSWYDEMIDYIDEHCASPEQIAAAVEEYLEEHPISAPVQSVNNKTGDVTLTASDVGAGTYSKPSGGIPKTDLASGVQSSLDKADSALQSYTETDPTVPSWAKQQNKPTYTAQEVGALPSDTTIPTKVSQLQNDSGFGTYSKPSGGIPKTDLASSVQASLDKADSALQTAPVTSVNNKTGAVTLSASDVGAGTYSKPSGGIPSTDMSSAVQTSLGKADTALQTAPVTSVNTKTGAVTLAAGDLGYDDEETYTSGTVGKEITDLKGGLNDIQTALYASTESSTTSAHAYAVGDYFTKDGAFYRVTDAIAVGDTLTVGTNIEVVTVTGELDAIYNGRGSGSTGSINKLNPEAVTANTSLSSTGELVTLNGYDLTEFIPLDTTASSVAFTGLNSDGTARVCLPINVLAFYDSNYTMTERHGSIASRTVTAIPSGAAYVRLCVDTTYISQRQGMVEFVDSVSDISSTFVPYEEVTERTKGLNDVIEDTEELIEKVDDMSATLIDLTGSTTDNLFSTYTNNAYWKSDNTQTSNNSWIATDAIDISDYSSISYSNSGEPGTTPVCLWTSSTNTVIAFFYQKAAGETLDVPEGAKYVKFSIRQDNKTSFRVVGNIAGQVSQNTRDISKLKPEVDTLSKVNAVITYGLTWDWWITCDSVDKFGNAYIGYVDTDGYAGIIRRQPDGVMQYKRLEKLYDDDDHNACATIVLDDGKILVIGSYGHTVNNHIICWRSVNPYSIDDMEKLSFDITGSGYTYRTCYSQVFKYDGKLFDFMRFGSSQTGESYTYGFACLISTDNGDTWTPYKVFNNTDAYNAIAQCTDDDKYLKVVVAANPAAGSNTFKGCYIDLSNYKIYDLSNTEIGQMVALNGGSIVDASCAQKSDMTDIIAQTTSTQKGRLFWTGQTTKATTVFLYAIATDNTDADFVYKLYNNGTVIDLGHSGTPFGNGHYISGACFGKDTNTIYYAKATTAKADGAHELHKVILSSGSVQSDEIITEASICILRPLFLGNGELATMVGHYNDQNDNGTYNGSFTAWELKPLFTNA